MKVADKSIIRLLFLPEDTPQVRQIGRQLAESPELIVKEISSTQEAVEQIRTGNWDAVLNGHRLGEGKSGLEFLRDIRRFDHIFPVFILTTESNPGVISAAFEAGANDYFVAEGTDSQLATIKDALGISIEIASLLRNKARGQGRNLFEEKYSLLFNELLEGSMIVSAESGTITFANETMAEALGRTPEELIGHALNPLLSERSGGVNSWEQMLQKARGDGDSVMQVNFHHVAGGERSFWTEVRSLDVSGKPVMVLQCRDVTRLEQLEREISAVRNQLKVIVENSADAIILARQDGGIEFIGGAAPRMFGISTQDAGVLTLDDLFGHQSNEIRKVVRQMGSRSRISGVESHIVSRWGTNVPVSIAITRLPSSDDVVRYLFNIMDVTSQKVIEAEKLMITELIGIMGSGAGPLESLPKLIERMKSKVPIDVGLVVSVDDDEDQLTVQAAYNSIDAQTVTAGQTLNREYLPAEEELWLREGIVRNNLQQFGLHPLETLLYREGARSYLSLPLIQNSKLIGGAHFGSSKAYALNRGHLSLFRQIASALSGSLRQTGGGQAATYRHFAKELAERWNGAVLLCDADMRILEHSSSVTELPGQSGSAGGSRLEIVLARTFALPRGAEHAVSQAREQPVPLEAMDGTTWLLEVVGLPRNRPASWLATLKLEDAGA